MENEYSFGDEYIVQRSQRLGKPGAPSTWIRADSNHHITYTAQQINRLVTIASREHSEQDLKKELENI